MQGEKENKMYKRIWYDFLAGKMWLWELQKDGSTLKMEYDHEIEYYIPDKLRESKTTDIYGNPVLKCTARNKSKIRQLKESGISCCESDLPEETKFLQKRYKGMDLKADVKDFTVMSLDIEVEAGDSFPKADLADRPINLISMRKLGTQEVFIFGVGDYTGGDTRIQYCPCSNERDLLISFYKFFKHCNVDILTGWNVLDFDVRYIMNRTKKLEISENISPVNSIHEDMHGNITVAGLTVWDYLILYKEFNRTTLESYSLDFVSKHELKKGKLYLDGGVNQAYKDDWNKFVEYNIRDVDLVVWLDEKLKLIDFAISLAYQALIPFNKVLSTIAVITGYMLKYIHQHDMVLNDRKDFSQEEYAGAWTDAIKGHYRNVLSFDVESEYPHIMLMFNISPETLVLNPSDDEILDLIKTPVPGVYYRKKVGILPKIVRFAFDDRKKFKQKQIIAELMESGKTDSKEISDAIGMDISEVEAKMEEISRESGSSFYYKGQQSIRKIIVNSIYGVLGNPYFHFYSIDNAKAVTYGGKALIQHLSSTINEFFVGGEWKNRPEFKDLDISIENDPVVLVDTDSCYVCMDEIYRKLGLDVSTGKKLIRESLDFIDNILSPFFDKTLQIFADRFGVEQLINFKHEKVITQQIVLKKKRYAAEYIYKEGVTYDEFKYDFVGVEVVRSSTPKFCRDTLRETIQSMFDELREGNNREKTLSKIVRIKQEFQNAPYEEISFPRGINKYDKYVHPIEMYLESGLSFSHRCPAAIKAAQVYNYIIAKLKLPLQPASAGDKVRYIYVKPNNEFGVEIVGFMGNCPDQLKKMFEVDYDKEFEKGFTNVLQEFFTTVGWGKIEFQFIDTGDCVEW